MGFEKIRMAVCDDVECTNQVVCIKGTMPSGWGQYYLSYSAKKGARVRVPLNAPVSHINLHETAVLLCDRCCIKYPLLGGPI